MAARRTAKIYFIEATVGAGKTSVLNSIAKHRPNWIIHPEPVNIWRTWQGINYLANYYTDPATWAYPLQVVILASFRAIMTDLCSGVHIFERGPRSSMKVFTKASFDKGYITATQLNELSAIMEDILAKIPNPVTFYLRTSPAVAFERVKFRARSEEMNGNVSLEYLELLQQLHDNEFLTNSILINEYENDELPVDFKALKIIRLIEDDIFTKCCMFH